MRYINGDFDPSEPLLDNHKKLLKSLLASADGADKDRMIRIINDDSGFLTADGKVQMCYFLGDEDFTNEHFAITFMVDNYLKASGAYVAILD